MRDFDVTGSHRPWTCSHYASRNGLRFDLDQTETRQKRIIDADGSVHGEGPSEAPKMFSKSRSFRQIDAESEIAFSKKDETFQELQGILSPLRLPVPPRPLWSPDQRLSAFSGQME